MISLFAKKIPAAAIILGMLLFASLMVSSPLHAEDIEKQMRDLLAESGRFPDEVLQPVDPVKDQLSLSDKLIRIWHRMLGFRVTYATARGKACHANQRVIIGAVEMYNMDKSPMKKTLRHEDATLDTGDLVTGRYLKMPIQLPDTDCRYKSLGDLTRNGIIYCTRHGCINEFYLAAMKVSGLKTPAETQSESLLFAGIGLSIVFLVSVAVLLAVFFSKHKPSATTRD